MISSGINLISNICSRFTGLYHLKAAARSTLVDASLLAPKLGCHDPLTPLEEKMPEIYERVTDLRKDIYIGHSREKAFAFAAGAHCSLGSPLIVIDPDFENLEAASFSHRFVLKHEAGHIYLNHSLKRNLLVFAARAINSLGVLILGYTAAYSSQENLDLPENSTYLYLKLGVGIIGTNLLLNKLESYLQIKNEKEADDFAIKNASEEELIMGRCFVQGEDIAQEVISLAIHKNNVSVERDNAHPSNIHRIQMIEQELDNRKVAFQQLDGDSKYLREQEALKKYVIKKNEKDIQEFLRSRGYTTKFVV